MKIEWFKNGKFIEDDIKYDMSDILKIVKFPYSDSFSFNGYRYFIMNEERKILYEIKNKIFHNFGGIVIDITMEEFDLIKKDLILISDPRAITVEKYFWSQLMDYFDENQFKI